METSSEVVQLDIRGREVRSVTCKNGKTYEGDFFMAACDANAIYQGLLKGQYPDPAFEMRFNNPEDY